MRSNNTRYLMYGRPDAMATTGGTYWNADKDRNTPVSAFVDAVQLRWSAAQEFTRVLAEQRVRLGYQALAGKNIAQAITQAISADVRSR